MTKKEREEIIEIMRAALEAFGDGAIQKQVDNPHTFTAEAFIYLRQRSDDTGLTSGQRSEKAFYMLQGYLKKLLGTDRTNAESTNAS